jgi:hypothetical protein
MNKRSLFLGLVVVSSGAYALNEPTFCSSPTMAYQSGCISSCKAIAAAGSFNASEFANGYQFCQGKATHHVIELYKIELGKQDVSNPSKCVIWDSTDHGGAPISVGIGSEDSGIMSGDGALDLSGCPRGVEYDAIYFTTGRYELIAGEATFPNDATKVARTTSTYAAIDSSHGISSVSDWRENDFNDSAYFYTGGTYSSASQFKKLTQSRTGLGDMMAQSNQNMYVDWMKNAFNTDTSSRPGFQCNPSDTTECEKAVGSSLDRIETIMPSDYISGMPFTLSGDQNAIDMNWYKFKGDQGGNNEMGIKFLWYWDGATLYPVAIDFGEDGGYLEVSAPYVVDLGE